MESYQKNPDKYDSDKYKYLTPIDDEYDGQDHRDDKEVLGRHRPSPPPETRCEPLRAAGSYVILRHV
jgi:hypothetical protein